MANGCPAAIHDDDSDTALPSESFLPPGDFTPSGYLQVSVALAQISGHIFQGMYSVPTSLPNGRGNRLSRRTVADLYTELVKWRHNVASHLRIHTNTPPTTPSVMRAIAFLDLRFQFAIISVTRPLLFRLVSSARDTTFPTLSADSRTFITTYSEACVQSARSSLITLQYMQQHNLLNNVLWLDAFYILSTAMVLLLEYQRSGAVAEAHRVVSCIAILRALQPRGPGRIVLESLADIATFLGLDSLPLEDAQAVAPTTGELQLYELFSSTPSSVGTAVSSPEISVNEMSGFTGFSGLEGVNEFAWMDQVVRMAYEGYEQQN
jgi:hypothetical protein